MIPVARGCCAAALFVLAAAPSQAQELKVALTLETSSWMADASLNPGAIGAPCAAEGVTLTPASATDAAATATVRYHASQGRQISRPGEPLQYATQIAYRLEFRSKTATPRRLVLETRVETPQNFAPATPSDAAARALIRQPEFRYSCTAMAAALGSQAAMRRLLSWAVIAERGLEVVDAMKFTAATTEDEAYIAVARRRFPDVARLGVNALAPLSLLFVSTSASPGEERLGAGYLDPAAHADVLVDAAAALANIGDARATPALLVFLHDHALDVTGARLERIVLAVLDALGRVGDPLAVPVLEEWRARTGAVGTSAERALASVRQRHSTR